MFDHSIPTLFQRLLSPASALSQRTNKDKVSAKRNNWHDSTRYLSSGSESNAANLVVSLLDFVVEAEDQDQDNANLSSLLDFLLSRSFEAEFSSFVDVEIQIREWEVLNGSFRELSYSGSASFNSSVWYEDVFETQRRALRNNEAIIEIVPYVTSIRISEEQLIGGNDSTLMNVATIAGLAAGAVLVLIVASILGYYYYKTPSVSKATKGGRVISQKPKVEEDCSNEIDMAETDILRVMPTRTDMDEYSLDAVSSVADSEIEKNVTRNYLAQRQIEKERIKLGRKDSYSGDESEACFSYENIGKKGLMSDDEGIYLTDLENDRIEVGIDGSTSYFTDFQGDFLSENIEEDDNVSMFTSSTGMPANISSANETYYSEQPFDETQSFTSSDGLTFGPRYIGKTSTQLD